MPSRPISVKRPRSSIAELPRQLDRRLVELAIGRPVERAGERGLAHPASTEAGLLEELRIVAELRLLRPVAGVGRMLRVQHRVDRLRPGVEAEPFRYLRQ